MNNLDSIIRASIALKKRDGLFVDLTYVDDKDTMKWILVKFLKETMEFLSTSDEAKKTRRGKVVEDWIDANLNFPGEFHE